MKFAAGITLFNPTVQQLERVNRLKKSFNKIFIFDNSETNTMSSDFLFLDGIEVISDERGNMGLPYAFNRILACCNEYDFLCTLDQDSEFPPNDIQTLQNYILSLTENERNVIGIVAPYIDYGHGKHLLRERIEKKRWAITSGSFVNISVLRKENIRYDYNYFIDKFEIDLCQNLISKGYDIQMYHNATLYQTLGENSGHNHPNHNPLRHYYLFRNRFYFNNKWHKGPKKIFLNVAQTIRHVLLILLYENQKIKKIIALKQAVFDYRHKMMGKKNNFTLS